MEQGPKIVDIQTYLPVLMDLIRQGESACLTVTGNSMAPFLIHGRDQVSLCRPEGALRRGDIAFFQRESGEYIMHRICRVDGAGNYFLVGDGQQYIEGPVPPKQVFAVVTQVCRKGRWIEPGDFWWKFFAGAWLRLLPLRPAIRRLYGVYVRVFRRGGRSHGTA